MSICTCEQCGAQFPDTPAPLRSCPICDDEQQYVNWKGRTSTREALAQRCKLVGRDDFGVPGIGVEPSFAIGQRALLLRETDGCVMWDCIPLATSEAIDQVRSLGGLKAIAVSHPQKPVSWTRVNALRAQHPGRPPPTFSAPVRRICG